MVVDFAEERKNDCVFWGAQLISNALMALTSICTDGPIVDATYRLFQYTPLAPGGRLASMASTIDLRFNRRSSLPKLSLPNGTWTMPCLSARNSTLPPLNSDTALATSVVTVPALGLGMSPLGPSMRPSLAALGIMSGDAMSKSKSSIPPAISSTRSSEPAKSAPASLAAEMLSPCVSTATRTVLPVPLGRATVARSCWSLYLGSMLSRICASALSTNFAVAFSTISLTPSTGSTAVMRPGTLAFAFRKRLDIFASLDDLPSLRVARTGGDHSTSPSSSSSTDAAASSSAKSSPAAANTPTPRLPPRVTRAGALAASLTTEATLDFAANLDTSFAPGALAATTTRALVSAAIAAQVARKG
mmetsp:Transcript_4572/g.11284  ORF Transcript_4572/g.11284 Transcript_4572/m.11284 type:complete len:360 (-) Transcript_4572:53-1132(-)